MCQINIVNALLVALLAYRGAQMMVQAKVRSDTVSMFAGVMIVVCAIVVMKLPE